MVTKGLYDGQEWKCKYCKRHNKKRDKRCYYCKRMKNPKKFEIKKMNPQYDFWRKTH